jgi:hypothetical protein
VHRRRVQIIELAVIADEERAGLEIDLVFRGRIPLHRNGADRRMISKVPLQLPPLVLEAHELFGRPGDPHLMGGEVRHLGIIHGCRDAIGHGGIIVWERHAFIARGMIGQAPPRGLPIATVMPRPSASSFFAQIPPPPVSLVQHAPDVIYHTLPAGVSTVRARFPGL